MEREKEQEGEGGGGGAGEGGERDRDRDRQTDRQTEIHKEVEARNTLNCHFILLEPLCPHYPYEMICPNRFSCVKHWKGREEESDCKVAHPEASCCHTT